MKCPKLKHTYLPAVATFGEGKATEEYLERNRGFGAGLNHLDISRLYRGCHKKSIYTHERTGCKGATI